LGLRLSLAWLLLLLLLTDRSLDVWLGLLSRLRDYGLLLLGSAWLGLNHFDVLLLDFGDRCLHRGHNLLFLFWKWVLLLVAVGGHWLVVHQRRRG